jgi:hypothetical protein
MLLMNLMCYLMMGSDLLGKKALRDVHFQMLMFLNQLVRSNHSIEIIDRDHYPDPRLGFHFCKKSYQISHNL